MFVELFRKTVQIQQQAEQLNQQAAAALRESEQRFTRFMHHLAGLAWIKDLEGRYVYANDAALRTFPVAPAELYGKTDVEVFPPATAAQFRANDQRALASGTGVQVCETLEHADGTVHHSLVSKFPIPGPDGQPALIGGMAIDITEQMRIRAVLEESEARFRQLADNVNAVFWISDPHKAQVLYVSPAYETIWGRSCRSLYDQPRSFFDAIHPDDQPRVYEQSLARQARGETANVEYRVVRPDGSLRWVHDRGFPVRDAAGTVYRIVGIAEDITEAKNAEQALRESEERFHTLADSIPQLAWMARPDGHMVWYNRRWYEYSGKTPEQMQGWGWRSVHDRGELLRVLKYWRAALATGQPWEDTFPLRRHDGQMRWHLSRALPVRDLQGRVVRWFGTNTDITDHIEMEAKLKEADRRKDEFLAMLAHELRNPLAPIRNALYMLGLPATAGPAADQARAMVERQVHNMVRLVDDLLDVSRITRGKIQLRMETLDLATILHRAVEATRPLIEANRHTLTLTLSPESTRVIADSTRLEQVFANLLNNAAKYTERGGAIGLTAERHGDTVLVRVRDTGFGISAAVLPQIFDLFTQGDRTLDRAQGGLGIGLTLVKTLVEMQGGSVTAASDGPGRGSEFVVRLPCCPDALAPLQNVQNDDGAATVATARLQVLIVEDNKDAADSLAMLLQLWGHAVRTSHDGLSGLKAARSYRPQVVFLDIGLPGLDGYEVARRLRGEFGAEMRLVAMTGYGQEDDRRRAQEAGFDAHLVKPADPAVLQHLLNGP